MEMESYEIDCKCGKGKMICKTANSEKNRGRMYYICPKAKAGRLEEACNLCRSAGQVSGVKRLSRVDNLLSRDFSTAAAAVSRFSWSVGLLETWLESWNDQ